MRRLLLICALLPAGCGGSDDPRPAIVATTAHTAELVRAVAGQGMRVVALVPPGADPHEYEPRPRDIAELPDSRVVFRSGGEIDQWLRGTLEAAGGDARIVDVGARVDAGSDDPHWWQDPDNARVAVKVIAGELLGLGVDAEGVRRRAAAYDRRLRELDREIAQCLAQLRPGERKLVTTHDSLGYFARRYGLEVAGAVIPSRSTQGQASAGEVDELVQTLRRERVKAIFSEHALPARVERAVADEAGVRLGKALWTDALDDGVGYIEAMRENAGAIAEGLSGGRVTCSTS